MYVILHPTCNLYVGCIHICSFTAAVLSSNVYISVMTLKEWEEMACLLHSALCEEQVVRCNADACSYDGFASHAVRWHKDLQCRTPFCWYPS